MKTSIQLSLISVAGFAAMSFGNVANAQSITGAGATFPAPIYAKWAAEYS